MTLTRFHFLYLLFEVPLCYRPGKPSFFPYTNLLHFHLCLIFSIATPANRWYSFRVNNVSFGFSSANSPSRANSSTTVFRDLSGWSEAEHWGSLGGLYSTAAGVPYDLFVRWDATGSTARPNIRFGE